jgi:rRNA maturation endonuclease Nob1
MSDEHVCYNCRVVFQNPEADKPKEEETTKCPVCGRADTEKLDEQGNQRFIRRMSFG